MTSPNQANDATWLWLSLSAVLVLLASVIGISLISSGALDPQPIGNRVFQSGLSQHTIGAHAKGLSWLEEPSVPDSFTVRLTAAHLGGETDVGYGLAVGNDRDYVVAAVSPLGYVAIWRESQRQLLSGDSDPTQSGNGQSVSSNISPGYPAWIMPWQIWPHVNTEQETNEIWLDVRDGKLIGIRINRELLWTNGKELGGDRLGLWQQSFGDLATIDFQQLELFVESDR